MFFRNFDFIANRLKRRPNKGKIQKYPRPFWAKPVEHIFDFVKWTMTDFSTSRNNYHRITDFHSSMIDMNQITRARVYTTRPKNDGLKKTFHWLRPRHNAFFKLKARIREPTCACVAGLEIEWRKQAWWNTHIQRACNPTHQSIFQIEDSGEWKLRIERRKIECL